MTGPLQNKRRLVAIIFAVVCVATLGIGIGFSELKSSKSPTIRVFRETQALDLVQMETNKRGNLVVVFKNVSTRPINGFVLALSPGPQITYDTTSGDRVIAPGGTQDLEIPVGAQVPEITVRVVMFADGDVEGNEVTVAEQKQERLAFKAELKRSLPLIGAAADAPDVGSPAIFEKLELAISNLEVDPSSQSSSGLNRAKQELTVAIHEVRARQELEKYRNQRECLHEFYKRIERRIAGL